MATFVPPGSTGVLHMLHRSALLLPLFLVLHASAQTWELKTPVKTKSELASVQMVDPTTGFAIDRMLGFVLKTTDAGATWERKPYNLIDNPRVLWMWDDQRGIIAANAGRFYHTDDGWASTTNVYEPTFNNISSLFFLNDELGWAGSESGKILRTTDGGLNWDEQTSGTTNAILSISFVNDQRGYASATGSLLFRTLNGGDTWEPMTQPANGNIFGLHFFDAMTGIGVGIGGLIIRTTDGGDNWMELTSPTANSLLGLRAHGNMALAMGTWGTVLRSTDAGENWTMQQLDPEDLLSAWVDPSGIGLLTGDARVYQTLDHGTTWTAAHVGTYHTMLNKVSFGNEENGASAGWLTMGGLENGVIRTMDGGRIWRNVTAGNSQWLGVHLRSDGTGWLGGGVGANRSTTDYFATSSTHPGPELAIRSTWAFDENTAIVGGGYINAGCYRTTNAGQDWTPSPTGNIYDLWFVNDTLGFCGGAGGALARTTDGGISWEPLDNIFNGDINSIFFLNDTLGFWAGGGGARTTDGGDTWTSMGLNNFMMSIFFTDPDTGYVVNVSGYVLRTTNGGNDWEELVPAPFDVLIGDATMVDGAIIAVGQSGDVFRAELQCPTTPQVPLVFQSGQTLFTAWRPQIQWYLDGEPLPDATWPWITTSEPGSYTVVVTDALGCTSAPSVPVVVINTAVEERAVDAFTVFPNPTNGQLTVTFTTNGTHTVQLCDAQGRVLRSERVSGSSATLDVRELPVGLYFLREVGGARAVRVVRD